MRLRSICAFVTLAMLCVTAPAFATTAGGATYNDQPAKPAHKANAKARRPARRSRSKPKAKPKAKPVAQPANNSNASTLLQANTGGQLYDAPNPAYAPTVPGTVAKILPNGLAAAPADAPVQIQRAIWAANHIIGLPYVWGGGHGSFQDTGYDCSGTVSYALHGGGMLDSPLDSSSFMHWGSAGEGQWFTVWTNPEHAYLVIAGIRLDTSAVGDPHGGSGPRWRPDNRSGSGFHARHLPSF